MSSHVVLSCRGGRGVGVLSVLVLARGKGRCTNDLGPAGVRLFTRTWNRTLDRTNDMTRDTTSPRKRPGTRDWRYCFRKNLGPQIREGPGTRYHGVLPSLHQMNKLKTLPSNVLCTLSVNINPTDYWSWNTSVFMQFLSLNCFGKKTEANRRVKLRGRLFRHHALAFYIFQVISLTQKD